MKRIYRWLEIITLSCLLTCTTSFISNVPELSQTVSANDIHGITRPMAERWAWWHFYTSNNGALPNGPEKIPINNQNFRVVSWWTRGHKRIVVKIMRKNPGLRDIEYRVYRVSTAGNLKLRNDAQTYSSGNTVWNIVSRQYHSLENTNSSQQINSMSPNDLNYQTISPLETAAAVLIYYDKVQGGHFATKGIEENGFNMSQTKVSKKYLNKPGRGIAYGIKPINDQVQEDFYTIDKNGKVYMYVNENRRPFKTVKLKTVINYINQTNQQAKVRQMSQMFHVEDIKPIR